MPALSIFPMHHLMLSLQCISFQLFQNLNVSWPRWRAFADPGGVIVITNHFARETGLLARIERIAAPFANLLGWHSDFEVSTVLGQPDLSVIEQNSLPPAGMMTFLVLQKGK